MGTLDTLYGGYHVSETVCLAGTQKVQMYDAAVPARGDNDGRKKQVVYVED